MMETRRGLSEHHVSLVGPVVLIGAGIIFLLNNMGVVSWDVWDALWRMWPVLLIAIGLDILIGRRSVLGSLVVVILLVGVLGAAVGLAAPSLSAAQTLSAQQISQPLEGATRAAVSIAPGVGALHLGAGEESSALVEGSIAVGQNERLTREFSKNGSTARYVLRSEGPVYGWSGRGPQWRGKNWDLQLNRDVALDLSVESGVGQAELDLARLKVTNLHVTSGVGQAQVTLPRSGTLDAQVDAGVGDVEITIPAGMAARIRVDGGLGKTTVDGNYQRSDHEYRSPNYDTATDKVDLRIHSGVGSVTVREQSEG